MSNPFYWWSGWPDAEAIDPQQKGMTMTNPALTAVTQPRTAAKGWTATVGGVITIILTALNQFGVFLPADWAPYIVTVTTILTAISVYFVPNARATAKPRD